VAIAGAALVGLVTLIGGAIDLWDRLSGPGRIEVTHSVGPADPADDDRPHWSDRETECRDSIFDEPPVLTREPMEGFDTFAPSEGDIGLDQRALGSLATQPWVHEQIIDLAPESFSLAEFIDAGAYQAGPQEVHVLISNRTDEDLIVTGISVEVERHNVPTGTIAVQLGGDPTALTVLTFDLGEPSPVAYGINDDCSVGPPFFDEYVFEVGSNDTEVLQAELLPGNCLCLVRLHVEYGHAGEWKSFAVPPADEEPIPVVAGGPGGNHDYDIVYVDTSFSEPPVPDKHDCRRESVDYFC